MSDLTSVLESTLAQANAQLTALGGAATEEHLNLVGAIIAAMEQARMSAESRQTALSARDAAASAAADAYFEAIGWVREAIATDGELSPTEITALDSQLKDVLTVPTEEDLTPLLAEVASYDQIGSDAVTTARTELDAATAALKTAEVDFAIQQAALDVASQAVTTLAAQAIAMGTLAFQQLASAETAIGAGQPYQAVVHFQDLTHTSDALEAEIAFDGSGFAAKSDSVTVKDALDAAWTAARGNYETALTTLVDEQGTFFAKQLALAVAEADADERQARRLVDAAAQVETVHKELGESE